jgi:hypothetical protein
VVATSNEDHILAGLSQPPPEVPANAACSENRYSNITIL